MKAEDATFIIRGDANIRYNVKTIQNIPIQSRMHVVRKWVEENKIEPEPNSVIDVYLDE